MKRLLLRLFDKIVIPFLHRVSVRVAAYDHEKKRDFFARELQSMGAGSFIHPTVQILQPRAVIIGSNVHIGQHTFIHGEGGLSIGDHVHISRRVTIYASDHNHTMYDYVPYGPSRVWRSTTIEPGVWIGMNASILPGVTIGRGSIIGMGAVVAKDVPAYSIVVQQPYRLVGQRNRDEFERAFEEDRIGAVNGKPLSSTIMERSRNERIDFADNGSLSSAGKRRFVFVLTTGRSGSTSFADAFIGSKRVWARHEPRLDLVRISTELAHGRISRDDAKSQIIELFSKSAFPQCEVVLESDQKYFNLIPILDQLFPEAKFVWLTRRGDDVVSSAVGRGWYGDLFHSVRYSRDNLLDDFRIDGELCGDVVSDEWRQMTPFEKCCWYWSYVNRKIEADLSQIESNRWLRLKIEKLDQRRSEISEFLDVSLDEFSPKTSNKANYSITSRHKWTPEQIKIFETHCSQIMNKLGY